MTNGPAHRPPSMLARFQRALVRAGQAGLILAGALFCAAPALADSYLVSDNISGNPGTFDLNAIVPPGSTNVNIRAYLMVQGAYQMNAYGIGWQLEADIAGQHHEDNGSTNSLNHQVEISLDFNGLTYANGTWTAASVIKRTGGSVVSTVNNYNIGNGSAVPYTLLAWVYADHTFENGWLVVEYNPPPPNNPPTGGWGSLPGTLYPGTSATVSANGSDSNGNLSAITIQMRTNGGAWNALASAGAGSGSSNSTSGGFTAGAAGTAYQFRYKVDDAVGATTGWIESGIYTVQVIGINFNPSPLAFTYNGSPQGPNANPSNGSATYNATGEPTAVGAGDHNVTYTAYGDYSGSRSVTYNIAKAGQAISWTSAPGSVNAGSSLVFTATGAATGSYTWSVSPAGPTGISGNGASQTITFPASGSFTVSVYANGDANYNASSTINTGVTVASLAPVVTSPGTATLTYGSSGSYQITGTNSPTSYNASGLPPGMSVNTSTGLISGTPTAVTGSPFSSTVYATGAGGTGSKTVVFTVNKANQALSWTQAPTATSTGGSLTFIATGSASGVYNWSVSPAGPTGISGTGASQTITFPSSGAFTVSVYAGSNSNYNQSPTINNGVTVTSSPPVVTSPTSATLTYGSAGSYQVVGTNSPTSYSASGLPPGMTINTGTGLISGTPTTTVGSPFAATVYATNAGGSGSQGVSFTVNKAPLAVSANAASKVFGSANPSFTPSYSGFRNGDTAAVLSGAPSLTTSVGTNTNVGSYPIVVATGSLAATNYYFNFSNGTFSVTPKAITVTAASPSKIYSGTPLAVGNPAVSGLVAGDALTGFTGTTSVGPGANTYGTSVTAITTTLGASNYTPTYVSGTATISKASLVVAAANVSKVYGEVLPALSPTYSGFVNGETVAVLAGAPALSTTATVSSPTGDYPISVAVGSLSSANYSFSFGGGTLSVTNASQTVAISPASATILTGASITFTPSGGQAGTYNWGGTSGATGTGTSKTVTFNSAGTFTVTAQAPAAPNYNASNVATATITVNTPVAGFSSAGSLDFAGTHIGVDQATRDGGATSRTLVLTINNTGTAPLTIASAVISGAHQTDFTVVAVNGGAVAFPMNIPVGNSGTITVRFSPATAVTAGARSATMTLANNSPNNPSAAISLSGIAYGGILVTTPGAFRSLP